MSPQLVQMIEAALQTLDSWKGQWLTINESLSRLRNEVWSHDRHVATQSQFPMQLERVGWLISGGNIDLSGRSGEHPSYYQLMTDRIVTVEGAAPDTVIFAERFEQEIERRSTIRLIHPSVELDPAS